jgi:uncharacterized membrane protein
MQQGKAIAIERQSNVAESDEFEEAVAEIRTSLKARANEKSGHAEKLADKLTIAFGSIPFLLLNGVWFVTWIVLNVGLIPGVPIFDPFPFGFLTMIVSLEAIILAIIVLISQNRAERIADLREEVALQVEEISEREVTKILEILTKLSEAQGIDLSNDKELDSMLCPTDMEKLADALEKEV